MVDFFNLGNHVFVIGAIGYCVGDFIRAFYDTATENNDHSMLEVNVGFFCLALWFVVDACIYFQAYLTSLDDEEDAEAAAAAAAAASRTGGSSTTPTVSCSSTSGASVSRRPILARRFHQIATTELGWAYILNLVASFGYSITSLLPCFEDFTDPHVYQQLDKAQIGIDLFNMCIFLLDACIFLHLCVVEMHSGSTQPNIAAVPGTGRGVTLPSISLRTGRVRRKTFCRPAAAYLWANICNVLASIGYLSFNAYALSRRVQIERTPPQEMLLESGVTPAEWYFENLRRVTREQRAMFFAADLLYLGCALLLEWAWYGEEMEYGEEENGGSGSGGVGGGGSGLSSDGSGLSLEMQQQQEQRSQHHVKMLSGGSVASDSSHLGVVGNGGDRRRQDIEMSETR